MIGPVFSLEWLLGSRRGKLDLLRRIYAGWLIVQFYFLIPSWFDLPRNQAKRTDMGRFVNSYLETLVGQHFLLLVLVTPAFVAGAVADEKANHTFDYLLTADLTAWEIVAGKLLGRLAQVGVIALAAAPLLCAVGGYGGLSPPLFLALAVVTAAPCFGLGAASLLASVWCRRTRDAVLSVYALLAVGALAFRLFHGYVEDLPTPAGAVDSWLVLADELLHCLAPLHVLEPAWQQQHAVDLLGRMLAAVLLWGAFGAACLALAVWRLRPAYRRQQETPRGTRSLAARANSRAPVGDDSISWKEREVDGIALLPWLRRLPRWAGVATVLLLTALLVFPYVDDVHAATPQLIATFILLLAGVVTGARASGTICGEREKQTWELLLLTPVETRSLVRAKFHGVLLACLPYYVAYALPMLLCAALRGIGSLIGMFILLMFTGVTAYFLAAVGIACSARSKSSWRSLVATLATGYGYCVVIYFASLIACGIFSTALLMLGFLLYGALKDKFPFGDYAELLTAATVIGVFCLVEGTFFWFASQLQLTSAESWIARNERTREAPRRMA